MLWIKYHLIINNRRDKWLLFSFTHRVHQYLLCQRLLKHLKCWDFYRHWTPHSGCSQLLCFTLFGFIRVATMRSPGCVEVTCVSVRVRALLRAHKGWPVLPPAHRGAESRARQRSGPRRSKKSPLKRLQSGGRTKRAHPLHEVAHTQPRTGPKCDRRARERLRCTRTKLAARLECRSHQWKMPTSYPSFSSGKTSFVILRKVPVRFRVSCHINASRS